jgi:predicted CoA-binding protein
MKSLREKTIAVVGVSADRAKYGYRIFTDLRAGGMKVEGVNPRLPAIDGVKIYPSLADLPARPDMVITVVPPAVTESVVEQAAQLDIPEIWMQPGSESETAVSKAREKGIKVTYNACFMTGHSFW